MRFNSYLDDIIVVDATKDSTAVRLTNPTWQWHLSLAMPGPRIIERDYN